MSLISLQQGARQASRPLSDNSSVPDSNASSLGQLPGVNPSSGQAADAMNGQEPMDIAQQMEPVDQQQRTEGAVHAEPRGMASASAAAGSDDVEGVSSGEAAAVGEAGSSRGGGRRGGSDGDDGGGSSCRMKRWLSSEDQMLLSPLLPPLPTTAGVPTVVAGAASRSKGQHNSIQDKQRAQNRGYQQQYRERQKATISMVRDCLSE